SAVGVDVGGAQAVATCSPCSALRTLPGHWERPVARVPQKSPASVMTIRPGGARPPTEVMVAFIDAQRAACRVEPICALLPIAPSTYYSAKAGAGDPEQRSQRAKRDVTLREEIRRVWEANLRVYGVRKVWRQLLREGIAVARCTVARLMRQMGLVGAIR